MIRSTLELFLDQPAVRDHLRRGSLLVGVSGGADSVALLRSLREVAPNFQFELIVAHFDHALRADSAEDAHWVQTLCKALEIPCQTERRTEADLPQAAMSEEAARKQRYDFFARMAEQTGCRALALAHTADDQVETVFHHIVRGSGLKGLQGIPAIRPFTVSTSEQVLLIRPFLQVFRTEIDAYLESIGQTCRTDSTNAQTDYTRNQLRHEILPLLRQKLNPRVDQALLQLSRQAAEAQEMVNEVATELLHAATLDRQQNSVRLQRSLLISHSPARLRALFALLWDVQQWPRQSLGFAHLNELAGMVLHQTPSRLSLPGRIEANCRTAIVELRRRS